MEKNSQYFRNLGWAQLQGRWGQPVVFTLVYIIIAYVSNSIVGLGFAGLVTLLLIPMAYSYSISFLNDKRTSDGFKIKALFDGYKDFMRIFETILVQNFYVLFWSLLLIVPGVIKSISYSQTYYVLKDNPELRLNAAIERSMAMMEGHKMQYFLLMLSFIGWLLLVIFTLGIAALWVSPYMNATFAHYYEYVKEEYGKKIVA